MSNIIVQFEMFDKYQKVLVYENGALSFQINVPVGELQNTIYKLASQYNTNRVSLVGPGSFVDKYVKELKSAETRYNLGLDIEIVRRK